MIEINISMSIICLIYTCILLLECKNEYNYIKVNSRAFVYIVCMNLGLLLVNIIYFLCAKCLYVAHHDIFLVVDRVLFNVYVCVYYFIIILFTNFVMVNIKRSTEKVESGFKWFMIIVLFVCIASAIIWIFPSTNNLLVEKMECECNPDSFYLIGQIGGYICVTILVYLILRYRKDLGKDKTIAFLIFALAPFSTSLFRFVSKDIQYMPIAISLTLMLMHVYISNSIMNTMRAQEKIILEDRMNMLVEEVKPHFIFNVLNSVYYLCEESPNEAREAVGRLSEYVRRNLENVNEGLTIDISDEILQVKNYVELEKFRFQDMVKAEYYIKDVSFKVPTLSIQPIVENSIKHGLNKKDEGGTVKIVVDETENFYIIKVEDDGIGFDVEKVKTDGKTHIGLENVSERFKYICHAKMTVESEEGKGTVVIVRIPKSHESFDD